MNSKILLAFGAGALIASGIVFVAVRPEEAPLPPPVIVHAKPSAPVLVAAQTDPPPAQVEPSAEPAAPKPVDLDPVPAPVRAPAPPPVREKPSPVRRERPARREEPVVLARNEPPAPTAAPAPIPPAQPVVTAPPAPPPPEQAPPAAVFQPPVFQSPAPQPAAPQPAPSIPPLPTPEIRTPNSVTIQPGTILSVRIGETISSVRNEVGDGFLATLDWPLVVDGFVIAERGARVEGRVVEAERPGRVNAQSHLGVEITQLSTSDGQRIRIRTAPFKKGGSSSTGSDLAKVGVGAAIGAAIGGAAAGGKGAAIGAGVGGAAGTADVLLTRGKPAEIPVETRIRFRVQEPITITERLQ